MNSDNIQGTFEKLTGKIKETVGDLTHNDQLKREGIAEQLKGAARDTLGDAKETGKAVVESASKLIQK